MLKKYTCRTYQTILRGCEYITHMHLTYVNFKMDGNHLNQQQHIVFIMSGALYTKTSIFVKIYVALSLSGCLTILI